MISRTAACLAGIVGGLCWIARYALDALDLVSADGTTGEVLLWAGGTWLLLALAGAGVGLVRRAPIWLRIVVGVATPLLGLVLLSLTYEWLDTVLANAIFGAILLAGSLVLLLRGRSPAEPAPA